MGFRDLGAATVIAAVLASGASAQSEVGDAERNWAAIVACSAIDSARARQACMDGVVRQSGAISDEQVEQRARREFGREENTRPVNAPAAAARPADSPSATQAQAQTDVTEIATRIASVRTVGYQKLRVTTEDGSVWDQTQGESFNANPRAGDSFSIERTTFGAFRCRFAQAKRYYCQRVD